MSYICSIKQKPRTMRRLILMAALSLLLPSCSRHDNHGVSPDIVVADTLIYDHLDSFYTNPEETELHFKSAQKKMTDSSAINQLELFIGMSHYFRGDRKSCDSSFARVGSYSRRHPDDHALAGLLWNHRAIVSMLGGQRDLAVKYFRKSYDELVAAADTARACDVSINLSGLLREKGEMAQAAGVLLDASQFSQGRGDKTIHFAIQYMLGAIYADMYSFDIAHQYFARAAKLLPQASLNDRYLFYNARGNCYFFEKQYARALNDFRASAKLAPQLNNKAYEAIANSNIGEVMHSEGKSREALPLLLSAERTIKESGAGDPRSTAYLNDLIAAVEFSCGNVSAARSRFLATDTTALADNPRYMMIHYERLADFYRRTGRFAEAYESLAKARGYGSSMRDKLFREQMADAHQRYLRDKELASRNAEISRQKEHVDNLRNLVVALAVVASVLIVGVVLYYRRRRQLVLARYQHQLMQLSLQNVRNRLSPHFIMNVLGREVDVNNEGVMRLIKFIRQNLLLVEHAVIPLADEIDFVNTYVELERKSLSRDFDYRMQVGADVDVHAVQIPAMLLHVFVENTVKHGLRGQSGQLFLHIKIDHVLHGTLITIDNNGSDKQDDTNGTHTGLAVVEQTIGLLNRDNAVPISLNYGLKTKGVWHVSISIPDGYNFKELQE